MSTPTPKAQTEPLTNCVLVGLVGHSAIVMLGQGSCWLNPNLYITHSLNGGVHNPFIKWIKKCQPEPDVKIRRFVMNPKIPGRSSWVVGSVSNCPCSTLHFCLFFQVRLNHLLFIFFNPINKFPGFRFEPIHGGDIA